MNGKLTSWLVVAEALESTKMADFTWAMIDTIPGGGRADGAGTPHLQIMQNCTLNVLEENSSCQIEITTIASLLHPC
ncbi:hypothetical protein O9929_08510 [Vibrio lentus]|nr:hypothetical protein [Vibrio lentus]